MTKLYIKDLKPEEVIERLKNGEIIHINGCDDKIEMISGVICVIKDERIVYNVALIVRDENDNGMYF